MRLHRSQTLLRKAVAAAFALNALLSVQPLTGAYASLYERPAGADYDFVHCSEPTRNPRQASACAALGLLECNRSITGNAFLVRAEGGGDVIVATSHSLIDPETDELFNDCRFLLQGTGPGFAIERAVLLNRSANTSLKYPDIAAARLAGAQAVPAWKIQLRSVQERELAGLLEESILDFAFIAIHPSKRVPIITAYACAPVPKVPGHRLSWIQTEMNHNCPTIPGFSGSPGMMHSTASGRYEAICVHESALGPKGRHPFDPTLNPNTCSVIPPEFIDLVHRLARDEPVDAPEGGATISYLRSPAN